MQTQFDPQDVQAVGECVVRAQQVLLGHGYGYAHGDPDTWPGSPVLMGKKGKLLLVAPILAVSQEDAAVLGRQVEALRSGGARLDGVVLVGPAGAESPAVGELLEGLIVAAAYLDAVGGGLRVNARASAAGRRVAAMREKDLRKLLSPKARAKYAHVDCRAQLARAMEELREVRQFQTDVSGAEPGRKPYGTYAVLAACIGVFALQAAMGVNVLAPSIRDLLAWGASYGPQIKAGQWWRLATSMFLHVGLVHLLFNMYAMHIFGRPLERFQGTWRLIAYFLFGGLAGSAASLWWSPLVVSAGASGGLFGMVGAMAAIYVRFWRDLPAILRRGIRSWLVTILFYNAIFLLVPVVDGAAHVGGLVGGFLMGLALARSPKAKAAPPRWALAVAGLLLGATIAFAAWAADRVPARDPVRNRLTDRRERGGRRDSRFSIWAAASSEAPTRSLGPCPNRKSKIGNRKSVRGSPHPPR